MLYIFYVTPKRIKDDTYIGIHGYEVDDDSTDKIATSLPRYTYTLLGHRLKSDKNVPAVTASAIIDMEIRLTGEIRCLATEVVKVLDEALEDKNDYTLISKHLQRDTVVRDGVRIIYKPPNVKDVGLDISRVYLNIAIRSKTKGIVVTKYDPLEYFKEKNNRHEAMFLSKVLVDRPANIKYPMLTNANELDMLGVNDGSVTYAVVKGVDNETDEIYKKVYDKGLVMMDTVKMHNPRILNLIKRKPKAIEIDKEGSILVDEVEIGKFIRKPAMARAGIRFLSSLCEVIDRPREEFTFVDITEKLLKRSESRNVMTLKGPNNIKIRLVIGESLPSKIALNKLLKLGYQFFLLQHKDDIYVLIEKENVKILLSNMTFRNIPF